MNKTLANTFQFQERSIKTWLSEMDNIFYDFEYEKAIPSTVDFSSKEIGEAKRQRFENLADRVYTLCVAYFETKNLPQYIVKFDAKILPFFKDRKLMWSSYSTLMDTRSEIT